MSLIKQAMFYRRFNIFSILIGYTQTPYLLKYIEGYKDLNKE